MQRAPPRTPTTTAATERCPRRLQCVRDDPAPFRRRQPHHGEPLSSPGPFPVGYVHRDGAATPALTVGTTTRNSEYSFSDSENAFGSVQNHTRSRSSTNSAVAQWSEARRTARGRGFDSPQRRIKPTFWSATLARGPHLSATVVATQAHTHMPRRHQLGAGPPVSDPGHGCAA